MRTREISSLDQHQFFNSYSELPAVLLDWIESNNHGDVFVVWNAEDQICYVSKSFTGLLGYKAEEIVGNFWYERLKKVDAERIQNYLDENRKESEIFQFEISNKDKKSIYVECMLAKLEDVTSGEIYTISYLRNLTEYREAKDLRIHSEKMSVLGQLSAGIAHEIRNPLTSIKGFLQLLQAGVQHKDEYYKIMKDEIEKIEAITSELLHIARPATNKKKDESVDQMIRDVVMLLNSQAKMKNIIIKIEQPITEIIYCDSSQVKQVLINLVKNAIEAMEEPGEITLYVRSNSTHVTIHVKDEGPGIPEELNEHLGEPFFTTKTDGTGLGLMITQEILEHHGGTLSFSDNIDKGSTFHLLFPKIIK